MLIRFTVENFLSFKDEVEFSMVAGRPRKHPDHILPRKSKRDLRILKTAVIYGANASGKSNLIKAMSFARNLIVEGRSEGQYIPVSPFRFDTAYNDKPSKFQFEIKCSTASYVYGFEVDSRRVHSEWLYEIHTSRHDLIFERRTDSEDNVTLEPESLGVTIDKRTGFIPYLLDTVQSNQLFLKHGVANRVSHFYDIYDWFRKSLVLIYPDTRLSVGFGIMFKNNQDYKRRFRNIISSFDLGFSDIDLPETDLESEWRLPPEVREYVIQKIKELPRESGGNVAAYIEDLNIYIEVDKNDDVRAYKFETIHNVVGQRSPARMELTDESDGTRRVFDLVPALISLLSDDRERVCVIDELDRRLHANLSHKIIELFLAKSEQLSSQLIVTTHELQLLDLDLLRRDEVWFIEKNARGSSTAFSLEEFHPRYDKDIRKSYLQGRFGAIPLLPSRRSLELRQ
ncbi:MAG: ATP-binding protein [Chloroflexota bacterium]|nr:ATP-binding protein [Chloroflexota bacterium]MDE2951926.1 ATP-binding protein [Chloroflexota bacterium]